MGIAPVTATQTELVAQSHKVQAEPVSASRKAALGFEQLLVRELAEELAKSAQPDEEETSAVTDTLRSLLPDALSDAVARAGGFGLADTLEKGLS